MKAKEIDRLPIKPDIPPSSRKIRRFAPKYLESIIASRVMPGVKSIDELRPEHIEALSGGNDAAIYLVNSPEHNLRLIIKLSYSGLEAEAEALEAWRQRSVHVPGVIAHGIVPLTRKDSQKVKFLIEEAMVDGHGRLVETCAVYLTHEPGQARRIGRLLGQELTKLHQAVTKRSFGDFADSGGNTAPYQTWNGYLLGYIDMHRKYLNELGVSDAQIDKLRNIIENYKFLRRGRYVHGDFSVRNSAIRSHNPLKLVLFDPNSVIGDPTWDIAVLANNYAYRKLRLKHDDLERDLYRRDLQLWIGFRQAYERQIDQGSLEFSQLIQAILQTAFQRDQTNPDKVKLRVRHEFIIELIETILKRRR